MTNDQQIATEPIEPKYNLNDAEEKKLILRHYRTLLRQLGTKLKKGDKVIVRQAFEMSARCS